MPKGRKIVPVIGDMIQMKDAVAICTDLLTSTLSDKQVYEFLFLKDNVTRYVSLAQLGDVKRATPETMRAYMMGHKVFVPVTKPTRVKKTKVTQRKRAIVAAAAESAS